MIQTVKEQRNIETNELISYIVNNSLFVPIDEKNTDYQEVQRWIAGGGSVEPAYTEQEKLNYIKTKKLAALKRSRNSEVDNIVITTSNNYVLNGDELSQNRMTRAISALPDDTTIIQWIGANGDVYDLIRPDLVEALFLAGELQTITFGKYASLKAQVNSATTISEVEAIIW